MCNIAILNNIPSNADRLLAHKFRAMHAAKFSVCDVCQKGFTGFMKQSTKCVGKLWLCTTFREISPLKRDGGNSNNDPRYGYVVNKSLGTRLRTAENGVHTGEFSSLVRRQAGELSLSSTHMLKLTDMVCFCQVKKLFIRSDIPTALFCHGQTDRRTDKQTDRSNRLTPPACAG